MSRPTLDVRELVERLERVNARIEIIPMERVRVVERQDRWRRRRRCFKMWWRALKDIQVVLALGTREESQV
jgi:hypothetical protein